MITDLINAGVSGFPNGSLTRRTMDAQTVSAGCVSLAVVSEQAATVRVSGYTPCDHPDDCTPPQQCNLTLQLCE
jgi:hypothetical protein